MITGKAVAERIGPGGVEGVKTSYFLTGIPCDRLPYTPQFDQIHGRVTGNGYLNITKHELWMLLCALRKSGKLPVIRDLKKGKP